MACDHRLSARERKSILLALSQLGAALLFLLYVLGLSIQSFRGVGP